MTSILIDADAEQTPPPSAPTADHKWQLIHMSVPGADCDRQEFLTQQDECTLLVLLLVHFAHPSTLHMQLSAPQLGTTEQGAHTRLLTPPGAFK